MRKEWDEFHHAAQREGAALIGGGFGSSQSE